MHVESVSENDDEENNFVGRGDPGGLLPLEEKKRGGFERGANYFRGDFAGDAGSE